MGWPSPSQIYIITNNFSPKHETCAHASVVGWRGDLPGGGGAGALGKLVGRQHGPKKMGPASRVGKTCVHLTRH